MYYNEAAKCPPPGMHRRGVINVRRARKGMVLMELKALVGVIVKRLWIIILVPVLAAGVSAIITSFAMEPVYESTATLYVINKAYDPQTPVGYNDILVARQLIKDYRELVTSKSVTKAVIQELELVGMTAAKLADKISVGFKSDTSVFEIKVQDQDPVRAMNIANKTSELFIKKAAGIMQVENISIVDYAEAPDFPISPKPLSNILAAFIAGLLAVLGIVFFLEYMDDTVRDLYEVENDLKLKVLGIIPSSDVK
jgi:capsular polysaccharide biosynthesis protein